MSFRISIFSVCTAVVLSSCLRESNPSNYTAAPPIVEALAGTYLPTEHTTELLKATGKYPSAKSSITLGDDGAISIENVPDWWLSSFGEAKGKFDNAKGKWVVDRSRSWYILMATFQTANSQFSTKVPPTGNVTAMISLVGQKPPYLLQLSVSDPNADVTMQYEKVKP
jgi:hypothetical protein